MTKAVKRRKEIWEALHPVKAQRFESVFEALGVEAETDTVGGATCATNDDLRSDGRKKGPQHHQAFASETAAVTGESKSQINRHLARAEALGDDLDKVTGTSLDKGVELLALSDGDGVAGMGPARPQRARQRRRDGLVSDPRHPTDPASVPGFCFAAGHGACAQRGPGSLVRVRHARARRGTANESFSHYHN
ncbi:MULTISPECIES: hypothetical protein [unclassified Acidovorax]|uniref:hypothetical protein n=1 Tax=unclassified Acidovorax TaxID=2684926 RepID=UPI000B3F8D60|nr:MULTISPECIES: hypothetical protein [unclassified Acidovorax]